MTDSAVPSSEDLARAARAGCRESYEELVRRHHGRLYQFLLWRSGSVQDAEDLTQETFLLAWRKLHRYRERWPFRTWLYTLGWRLTVSRWRRRAAPVALGEDPRARTGEPHEILGRAETRSSLWRLAAEVLSRDSLTALWLHYGEDLSMEEVARVLGKRSGAIRVMLHRARRKLASHRNGSAGRVAAGSPDSRPAPVFARGTT